MPTSKLVVATLTFYYINSMALKRFPIGVQDFARIREDGMYYVDKTDLVYKLTHTDPYYFLSRPRRFGKSLLVSTLQYYFEGRKDLYKNYGISSYAGAVKDGNVNLYRYMYDNGTAKYWVAKW